MRFAGPDVVLFVAGFVLFAGAGYGLYQVEGLGAATSPFGLFTVSWTSAEVELEPQSFETAPTFEFVFNVTDASAQTVKVLVECAHAANLPGQVSTAIDATLTAPDGATETASGNCGSSFEVAVATGTAPTRSTVEAANADEARTVAAETVTFNATGEWAVALTFTSSAQGAPLNPISWSGTATPVLVTYAPGQADPVTK